MALLGGGGGGSIESLNNRSTVEEALTDLLLPFNQTLRGWSQGVQDNPKVNRMILNLERHNFLWTLFPVPLFAFSKHIFHDCSQHASLSLSLSPNLVASQYLAINSRKRVCSHFSLSFKINVLVLLSTFSTSFIMKFLFQQTSKTWVSNSGWSSEPRSPGTSATATSWHPHFCICWLLCHISPLLIYGIFFPFSSR